MSDRNNDFSLLVKLLNGFLKKDEIKKGYILLLKKKLMIGKNGCK